SGLSKFFWVEDITMSPYLVNRSPSSTIEFKMPIDMIGTGSMQVLQGVKFEVEPQEDHAFEVEPLMNQHSTREVYRYRENSNKATFAVAIVENIYAHESLTLNDTVTYEVISKWKAELKEYIDARSNVYAVINSCRKRSLLVKAKENAPGLEIVRDQSGNTLRVSQSRVYNEKLVHDCANMGTDEFRRTPPAKGVGLRVADSHTGNHPEDDFTPLETIRRPYSVIRKRISFELEGETFEPERGVIITIFLIMSAKDSIATQTCEPSKEEFNDFLTLYPIPSEYHVIIPKSNQTVFDAPPGYVGLYTHSFSFANLRLPLTEFFYEVLKYFQHERFFYVQDSIIPAKYSQLLSEQNKLDSKSFKDKLPPNIEENPMFQHLGRYPTSVCVFPDPILFLDGLKSSWEHGQQHPVILVGGKEPSPGLSTRSPSVSINAEPLKADKELMIEPAEVTADYRESLKPELFVVHPGSVAAHIKDSKCKTRGGSSRPPVKRKLTLGSSTSRATRSKTSSLKEDVPFLTVSDDDEGIPDNHLDNHMDLELLDLHDRCYTRQDVVDNVVNRRERAREEECEGLRVKCEAVMIEFEKNPIVVALREKISALSTEVKEHKFNLNKMMLESQKWAGYQQSLLILESKEVEELKHGRREVVSKVVPYVAMKLVHSDDMGSLDDPSAPIEALLSKKPPTLQRPSPSRTQVPLPSSQRATSSTVLVSNPMSPPADASIVKPQSSQLH
ncbi:hypothetical protein Tco_0545679, partial [Tanacetum coccineum]